MIPDILSSPLAIWTIRLARRQSLTWIEFRKLVAASNFEMMLPIFSSSVSRRYLNATAGAACRMISSFLTRQSGPRKRLPPRQLSLLPHPTFHFALLIKHTDSTCPPTHPHH